MHPVFMYVPSLLIKLYLGTKLSASQHNSSNANRTFDTSRNGSQTVKPLPIRSIAARRRGENGPVGATITFPPTAWFC